MTSILDQDNLGAFCRHTHVAVKGRGAGSLANLVFGVKDIYDIAGHKTGFGSPDWLATHAPARRTAPAVEALLEAGADVVGKTQTDELTYSLAGENAHYGTPINVNAPGRIPGGSSSGSAAAVAGGLVDFALGSDTGGSVRAPASFCGIYGIRPTPGRISLEGACPLAPSFDTCGWFARDPVLLERVGRVLLGDTSQGKPGAVLIADDAFEIAGETVTNALRPALNRISSLIGKPAQVTLSSEGLSRWSLIFRVLQGAEIWAQHGEWVTTVKPALGPGVKERIEWTSTIAAEDVDMAREKRAAIARRMDALLAGNAVMIVPTTPGIAPLRDRPQEEMNDFRHRALSLLCVAGLARLPQLSLPFASMDGCPLGISLIAARGNDMLLLALARELAPL